MPAAENLDSLLERYEDRELRDAYDKMSEGDRRDLQTVYEAHGLEGARAFAAAWRRTDETAAAAAEAGAAAEEATNADLLPGVLAGALLGELEELVASASSTRFRDSDHQETTSATIANLASAANDLDRIRARADDATAGPVIDAKIVRRAAAYLARAAEMIHRTETVRGRRTSDDGLDVGHFFEGRLIPQGYEDLDPATLQDAASRLLAAAGEQA